MTSNCYMPKFPLPDGIESADQYLRMLTMHGIKHRYPNDGDSKVRQRIEQELSVIAQLGCADYFLIIWDALCHARQKNILIGPGCHAAAGSIVNYCLGITQVDPLKYGLLFEIFLNTNRSFYPYLSIDGDERLYEEMLCYLPKRYGKNYVARIANNPNDIVISPEDITKHFATTNHTNRNGKAVLTIEEETSDVEDARFLIFGFFTPDYLSVIRDTLNIVKSRRKIDIDLLKIPLDDVETLQLFRSGQTKSIFEFGSEGMRRYLQQMPSVTFNDLVALYALYSLGPKKRISDFIACKRGEKRIEQPIIEMEALLSETYGLLVYQEQLMYAAQLIAGFTPNESDRLRKRMCMKQSTRFELKPKFIEGGLKNGHESIESLWQNWESQALYLYVKSHAVCYTLIAYQAAYLKAHFPTEYMSAIRLNYMTLKELLTKVEFDNVATFIALCRPELVECMADFKMAFDGMRNAEPANESEETITVELCDEGEGEGPYISAYLAYYVDDDVWENVVGRTVIIKGNSFCDDSPPSVFVVGRKVVIKEDLDLYQSDIDLSTVIIKENVEASLEEIVAVIMCAVTYFGFTPTDIRETIEKWESDREPPKNGNPYRMKWWHLMQKKHDSLCSKENIGKRTYTLDKEHPFRPVLRDKPMNRSKRKRAYRWEKRIGELERLSNRWDLLQKIRRSVPNADLSSFENLLFKAANCEVHRREDFSKEGAGLSYIYELLAEYDCSSGNISRNADFTLLWLQSPQTADADVLSKAANLFSKPFILQDCSSEYGRTRLTIVQLFNNTNSKNIQYYDEYD